MSKITIKPPTDPTDRLPFISNGYKVYLDDEPLGNVIGVTIKLKVGKRVQITLDIIGGVDAEVNGEVRFQPMKYQNRKTLPVPATPCNIRAIIDANKLP